MSKDTERRVEIIIVGVGGKGVLVAGELLVVGGMRDYKHTLWFPSYGPALRGGPSQCTVILSDKEIHSPTLSQADILLVMDPRMLVPFQDRVKSGGTAIIEEGTVELGSAELDRNDVTIYYVPSTRIATEMGNSRGANMVFLGVLIAKTGIVSTEAIEAEMNEKYKEKGEILSANLAALHKGLEIGTQGSPN
ncbi:MAG: 2-oxoacid:acceptor oxidoreductase family protein [Thermodesulfobacteriota bacterium]|nr:2-oxoacid:acceptor oxidoreductase family protein [Thermodesulfobacteriota bacterium]